jgi:hypothetical protein
MARATAGSELRTATGPSFVAAWAGREDDAALRRLLRETPMPGPIRITLEREPDFFRAAAAGWDRHYTAVAREPDTGEVFAMCSRAVRTVFLNGTPVPLGYLSQLRILPGYRAHKLRLLRAGFEWLAATREPGEALFDITTVVDDNSAARRLLTAALPGLPLYAELEPMLTFLIPAKRMHARSPSSVGRGRAALAGEIVDCLHRFCRRHQFAPHWTAADFLAGRVGQGKGDVRSVRCEDFFIVLRGDRIAGCVALWDQRTFKQVVVRAFSGFLACARPVLHLIGAGLPPCGSALPLAWLSHLAVDDDDPEIFESLVNAVRAELRGRPEIRWLALMLAARHPLVRAARRLRARSYASRLFAVHAPGTDVGLDGRIPFLEGALL